MENKRPGKTESRRSFILKSTISLGTLAIPGRLAAGPVHSPAGPQVENMLKDVKPLLREDYLDRQEAARRQMITRGISGLYLSGGINMLYFTGTSWGLSERIFSVILPVRGEPVWICPAFELGRAMERIRFGNDIRTWEEHESPYELVKQVCRDYGILGRKLGLGPETRSFEYPGLVTALAGSGTEITDASAVTENCRVFKTPGEIGYMDLANRIQKMAYREAFKDLRQGMRPGELASLVGQACSMMGVNGGAYPLFGQASAFPHGTKEQRGLEDGDIILIDGGCSVEGFRSDVTRTIVFGKPTGKQKKVFDLVLRAQQKAFNAVRPGVSCEDIDRIARKHMEDAGFGPDYKYFTHRLGHGIGMEGHEYTYLVRGNKTLLKPGMTFSNEPGIYIPGEFGVRIEDCFVVTEDGCRILGGMQSVSVEEPFG